MFSQWIVMSVSLSMLIEEGTIRSRLWPQRSSRSCSQLVITRVMRPHSDSRSRFSSGSSLISSKRLWETSSACSPSLAHMKGGNSRRRLWETSISVVDSR